MRGAAAVALALCAVGGKAAQGVGGRPPRRLWSLPDHFEGLWAGTPEYNILGPWSRPVTFGIGRAHNGDYIMQNNLDYDESPSTPYFDTLGWQRFYIEGSGVERGQLWYCGLLANYSAGGPDLAGAFRLNIFRATSEPAAHDTSVTFCVHTNDRSAGGPYAPHCEGCACGNWTLSLEADGTLVSSLLTGPSDPHSPSRHMLNRMRRVGPPPEAPHNMPQHGDRFSCDFGEGGRDAVPVARAQHPCPHVRGPPRPRPAPRRSAHAHCYHLNAATGYQLEWTVEGAMMHVTVSHEADLADSPYIAIGFRPLGRLTADLPGLISLADLTAAGSGHLFKFGMSGADIFVGHPGGFLTMYADTYTGPPKIDDSLAITNHSVSSEGGRVSHSFTRPLVSGKLHALGLYSPPLNWLLLPGVGDIIWATGTSAASSGQPGYHSHTRGLRHINWRNPESNMHEFRC